MNGMEVAKEAQVRDNKRLRDVCDRKESMENDCQSNVIPNSERNLSILQEENLLKKGNERG